MDGNKKDGNKEEDTVKSVNTLAKEMARKLIMQYVDDNVVAKVKSAASSVRTRPPPDFKSRSLNARPTVTQWKLLDTTLDEILGFISPTHGDFAMRNAIILQLRDLLRSVEGLRSVTVESYGSFVSELYTKWSDMDISVLTVGPTDVDETQHVLRQIYDAMRQAKSGFWYDMELIGGARVPILKGLCKHHRNASFDVSVNNVKGILKSKFFLWISRIDSRFRPLVLIVKKWAQVHNINSAKDGTLNSYSLCLLVIFHLQTCWPAILPPLQEIYPRNASDDLRGVRIEAEKRIQKIADANIARLRLDSKNTSSISDLLLSFFEKFSDITVKATNLGVCTWTGKWENINDNTRWVLPRKVQLFVEDPFDQPENAARSVSQLDKIADVFKKSSHSLASANDRNAIVHLLAGHTSQYE